MAKKAKTVRYAVLPDGSRREITGENGRYYVCGDAQFRQRRRRSSRTETKTTPEKRRNNAKGRATECFFSRPT